MSRFYLYGGNLTNGIEQGLAPYDSVEECLSAGSPNTAVDVPLWIGLRSRTLRQVQS